MQVPSFWAALLVGRRCPASSLASSAALSRCASVAFISRWTTFGMAQVIAKVIYNTRAVGASDGMTGADHQCQSRHHVDIERIAGRLLPGRAGRDNRAVRRCRLSARHAVRRLLIAIKANDRRVPFLGYKATTLRLGSYVLAATIATVSGALYPMLRGFVSPELLFFSTSATPSSPSSSAASAHWSARSMAACC